MDTMQGSLAMLLFLGAVHGINPGMGWLFAVSLGLQERRRGAVLRALGPLALGHGIAVGVAILLAGLLGLVIPTEVLKWIAAVALFAFGCYKLARHRHPRYGGMRVGPRQLAIWSFLMASAHGAGLMAVPFVLTGRSQAAHSGHVHGVAPLGGELPLASAAFGGGADLVGPVSVLAHTAGYFGVMALMALVVYERFGLRALRTAWINLDLLWATALILTAVTTAIL